MFRRITIALFVCLTLLALRATIPAQPVFAGATIVVNTTQDKDDAGDGLCSLREAIVAANNNQNYHGCNSADFGRDTLTFNIPASDGGCAAPNVCTIKLTDGKLPGIKSNITIDGAAQNITLNGFGRRMLFLERGAKLSLKSLTIADAYCGCSGGAISNEQGTLNILNTTFVNNGVGNDYGGGAIYTKGTTTIRNSTFTNNRAGYGGAIVNYGALTIQNSTFAQNNSAARGGALQNNGTLSISNSTFTRNTAYEGGAFDNNGSGDIRSSTFARNTAEHGGALSAHSGNLTVTNSTFWNNAANDLGGAVVNGSLASMNAANTALVNSTFADNTSAKRMGNVIGNVAALTLRNTLLVSSARGDNCVNFGRTLVIDASNLSTDSSCRSATVKTAAQINLMPLTDNGGPTKTMLLGLNSAALDAGSNTVCQAKIGAPDFGAGALDQRGQPRFNGKCDVGAVEQ